MNMNHKLQRLLKHGATLLLGLMFIVSCTMEIPEIEEGLDPNWQPSFVLPIASGTIKLGDLIDQLDDSLITEDPANGGLNIVYSEKDVFRYAISDMATIDENQSINLDPISVSDFDLTAVEFTVKSKTTFGAVVDDMVETEAARLNLPADLVKGLIVEGQPFPFDIPPTKAKVAPQLYTAPALDGIQLMSGDMVVTLVNGFKFDVKRFTGVLIEKATGDTIDKTGAPIDIDRGQTKAIKMSFGSGIDFTTGLEFAVTNIEVDERNVTTDPFIYNAADAFEVDATVENLTVTLENSMASEFPTDFDGVNDLELFLVEVKSGDIEMTLNSGIPVDGTLNLEFKNIVDATTGDAVMESFELEDGKFKSPAIISLAGKNIDFTKTSGAKNTLNFAYSFTALNAETYTNVSNASADVGVDIKSLQVNKIVANLGRAKVAIDPATMDLDLELFEKLQGDFTLAEPKLSMILNNPAIDAEMELVLNAVAKGSDGDLQMIHSNVPSSSEKFIRNIPRHSILTSNVQPDSINLDKENSNIQDIIALPPTKGFAFSGDIVINPNGVDPLHPNMILPDSVISLDIEMAMPLALQTSNLGYSEITEAGLFEEQEDKDNVDILNKASVVINGENGMPLSLSFKLYFLDSDSMRLPYDPIMLENIAAAQVDVDGNVTAPTKIDNIEIKVEDSQKEGLKAAKFFEYDVSLSSPKSGNTILPGRISSENTIELNIYVKATINGGEISTDN